MMRFILIPLILGSLLMACGTSRSPAISNSGFNITCDADPCPWEKVEGNPLFGGTWHPGDPGVDLSGDDPMAIQQKTTFESPEVLDYVLEATILRDPEVTLTFEFHWYRGNTGTGGFWENNPVLLRNDRLNIPEEGLRRIEKLTSVPSEAEGLILRIVKSGSGRCWVDELSYKALEENSG